MQDNYFNIGAALAGKYLSRRDGLFESGELDLTQEQFALLKTFVLSNSLKKPMRAVDRHPLCYSLTAKGDALFLQIPGGAYLYVGGAVFGAEAAGQNDDQVLIVKMSVTDKPAY